MPRNVNHQEAMRIAAEKMRRKKEREEQEEREFFERITSGWQWLIFKIVVVFCTLMAVLITIDTFVDGKTEPIGAEEIQLNRDWEFRWHKVLDVQGYMFTPHFNDWSDRDENSFEMTYSPIFRTGKKLHYNIQESERIVRSHTEKRKRTVFNWFPMVQIMLLIPLFTFLFKRQKPWFNFSRVVSLALIFPGTLLLIFFNLT